MILFEDLCASLKSEQRAIFETFAFIWLSQITNELDICFSIALNFQILLNNFNIEIARSVFLFHDHDTSSARCRC